MSTEDRSGREFILTLSCPDKPGIVYSVSSFLVQHSANIITSQQYGEPDDGLFFMRVHFSVPQPGTPGRRPRARLRLGGRVVPHDLAAARQVRADQDAADGLAARALPERPALPLVGGLAADRHRRRRLQPRGLPRPDRDLQGAVPLHPGDGRHQARRRGEAAVADRRDQDRAGGARPLHADPLARGVQAGRGPDDQHPPLVPAVASRAPSRTTRRTPRA